MSSPHPALDGEGSDPWRFSHAFCKKLVSKNEFPALSVLVCDKDLGKFVFHHGRQQLCDEPGTLRSDTLFSIASITKPLIALAALTLVEGGELSLGRRIAVNLPEFGTSSCPFRTVTLRHLLTHTSGLVDQVPNNTELRAAHAPSEEFVRSGLQTDPVFRPGSGCQYSSVGYGALGLLIQSVTGQSVGQFLRDSLLRPLGMVDTFLGLAESIARNRIPEIRLHDETEETETWNWNSEYWRTLGAPWGGLFSTAADLDRFASWVREPTSVPNSPLSPQIVDAATRNQLLSMPSVPTADRTFRPWGFGFRMNWPTHRYAFGEFSGSDVCGHWGATGTVLWIDRSANSHGIVLSTQPLTGKSDAHQRLLNVLTMND